MSTFVHVTRLNPSSTVAVTLSGGSSSLGSGPGPGSVLSEQDGKKNITVKQIIVIILGILILSLGLNFYNTYNTYHNTNTDCFEQVGQKLKTIQGNFLIVSENPPLFRYYAQQESAYYPDNLNEETLKEITNSANKKVYFVFTRFNSGFETEKWKNLNQIMKADYNLAFECSKDKEVNWIYSN